MGATGSTLRIGLGARASVLTCALVAFVAGCTIAELRRQESEDAGRVRLKEAAVQTEEQRAAELNRKKEELAADLSEQELSLDQLKARVQQLQAANAGQSEANQQLRSEQERLLRDIQEYSAELATLRRSPDNTSQEKRQRVEYLKRQIRTQLDILAH